MSDTIHQRLLALRKHMKQRSLDAYYVPSCDPHQNEYVPSIWQRRAWISGFTGSAGDVLVTQKHAYLWTDGRYFLQAEQEIDSRFYQLIKQTQGHTPIDAWLSAQKSGAICGVDSKVLSIAQASRLQDALKTSGGQLKSIEPNLIDAICQDFPCPPCQPISLLDIQYAGLSAQEKIQQVRNQLKAEHICAIALNVLDEIAWLLNLRGRDIDYNPLFISYVLLEQHQIRLFVDLKKITTSVRHYLKSQQVTLCDYDQVKAALNAYRGRMSLDANSASLWMEQQLTLADRVYENSPIALAKSCKNSIEQAGMKNAHELDAIAVIRFLCWLEHHWQQGIDEIKAASKLEHLRAQHPLCQGLSFHTISGFGANGAIIHYKANAQSVKVIDDSNLYLVDSGGQYLNGTTDITRTIHLGTPTTQQKHDYTLVLKGHLALARAIFPQGIGGSSLDVLARQFLWQKQLDYQHGTGHGVGCYLCVHEGPIAIRPGHEKDAPLMPGMVLSNEPGLYRPSHYGIRIENLLMVKEESQTSTWDNRAFYSFEQLTLVPYASKLIQTEQLTLEEIEQINHYHQNVYDVITPHLDSRERDWLASACRSLS